MHISLEEMRSKNPPAEAKAALELGDRRLLGVYAYSLHIPGVDMEFDEAACRFGGVIAIAGTTDFYETPAIRDFNEAAREYAMRYNSHIAYASAIKPLNLSLEEMLGKDPENLAKEALERGDRRLMGVYDYSLHTPGSGMELEESLRFGIAVIEGATGYSKKWAEILFRETASKYAARYNRYITKYKSPSELGRLTLDQWPPPPGRFQWEGWERVLANPVSKARAALKRGDRRLMAVEGETTETPGAEMNLPEAQKSFGIVLIDDTGDYVPAGYFFKDRAREYAFYYNRYIVRNASTNP